jgi:3-oxoacyl-[acyl-carrier protein] reductase/meso-butanediol dehydrogenase/(S,S)-butanediol dehydrogenase/diacetyl reductase
MGFELTGFEGRVAVVTGAGRMRSIGRAVAVALARAGCDVAVTGTGRDPSTFPPEERNAGWRDVDSVADEIRGQGRRALSAVLDIRDPEAVAGLERRVAEELGTATIVVNNASAGRGPDRAPAVDLALAVWEKVLAVNLTGTFVTATAFARAMVASGRGGSIVNISSLAGKDPLPQMSAYAASKAAVHSLTASMAKELGGAGVRVNAVCPGYIDTDRIADIVGSDDFADVLSSRVPLGRVGTPEDIAGLVVFLCSDQASWVTGQKWNVDGGMYTFG